MVGNYDHVLHVTVAAATTIMEALNVAVVMELVQNDIYQQGNEIRHRINLYA